MIVVNTVNIPADGVLELSGTEPDTLLALAPNPAIPLKTTGPVRYELTASMAGQDLIVTGKVQIEVASVCSRCLTDVQGDVTTDNLCLMYPKAVKKEIDITEDIREELLLSFPTYFYCRPDCKGLCSGCGADLNREKCKCGKSKKKAQTEPDGGESPWSALDGLTPSKLTNKPLQEK